MATYVEQGLIAPTVAGTVFQFSPTVVYSLTSAANGTELTGSGDTLVINSDAAGWLHVSTTEATDKAASAKTHRILADVPRDIGGVAKGMFVSFLADS